MWGMAPCHAVIDMQDPSRVRGGADEARTLLSGEYSQDGCQVRRVELRLYWERTDEKLGRYSLITSYVETDMGSVEMIYDEGFRGADPLGRAAAFLAENLGISALVLRSVLALRPAK